MSDLATLTGNHTLQLPDEIAKHFRPSDRFVVWVDGDTLHLKRVMPSPLQAVADAPEGDPLSLDEINDIVHEVRQQRRQSQDE
jgi:hypothetical protein